MTRTAVSPSTPAVQQPERTRAGGLLLTVILVGQFLAILNVNIVNVATPTIRADLHSSGAGLQMIVAGYTIVYAVLLITGARVGDLFGYRNAFLSGLALFALTTLGSGLAPSTGWLVAFRLAQGAGAALMMPQVMTLIQRNYQGAARGRALGLWSAVISGGIVVGQALGGVLLGLGAGWRIVFLVMVPIALLLLVVGMKVLPPDAGGARRAGLDPAGLVTLSAAVLLFVVPLVLGRDLGWPLWGWISMGLSVVMFVVFVRVERWVTARGGRPLVDASVLRAPGMRPGLGVLLFGPATWGAFLFTSALHLQGELHLTPLASGMMLVPCALAFALVGLGWPRLPARLQCRLVPFGYVVAAPAYVGLGLAAAGGLPYAAMSALIGAGLGVQVAVTNLATEQVADEYAADASGALLTVMQLGQVIGVSTVGTLFVSLQGHASASMSTAAALAGLAVLAGISSLFLVRRRATAPVVS
ncbi:MFS transporter [Nonomuraea roseoviolacea]|uniref:MFS family permease n=1 Tax=Nonomuraea roseoviolacea subsp. carminata TaxID=160689 RepID=A0ABT1JZW2_9ACTN|nr:MFS transporter [Nonomuraea roseoviolacea]MCP2346867.1 MFS family permease [Nonomuraea roseoviolacea subsp. carminata]